MARIYRTTDRIPLDFGEGLKITISPLSRAQKQEVQQLLLNTSKMVEGAALAIKYSVKDIEGVENFDGEQYQLNFNPDGSLTDDCVDELLNMSQSTKLSTVCVGLLGGISENLPDGVKFVGKKQTARKK